MTKPKSQLAIDLEALKAKQKEERDENRRRKAQETERKKQVRAAKDESTVSLIREVQDHPCIWNRGLREYSDRGKKDAAWSTIAMIWGKPESEARNTWKNLVDTMRKLVAANADRSGDGVNVSSEMVGDDARRWKFYDSLNFLRDSFTFRKSDGNYQGHSNEAQEALVENREVDLETNLTDNTIAPSVASTSAASNNASTSGANPPPPPIYKDKTLDKRANKRSRPSEIDKIDSQIEMLTKVFTQPENPLDKFLSYLGEVVSRAPLEKQNKLKKDLLSVAEAYTEYPDLDLQIILQINPIE